MTDQPSYPQPPFAARELAWPGPACHRQPPPDHGATRYVGHARLAERKALITGGDSGIGRAVPISFAFACEGADVAINDLPQDVLSTSQEAGLTTGNVWCSTDGGIGP